MKLLTLMFQVFTLWLLIKRVNGCLPHCTDCNYSGCNTCETEYIPQSYGCIKCPTGCATCKLEWDLSKTCQSCIAKYYQDSIECKACPNECATCTSSTVCGSCITKYYLSSSYCQACPNECATCTSSSVCNSCVAGYYLSSQQCPQCSTGCAACLSNTNCNSCSAHYYLSSNQCYNCPTICNTCTSPTVCKSCIDGYYLSGNTCIGCLSPCSKCVNSSSQCTDCITGYSLFGSNCIQCTQPSCKDCQNAITYCTSCLDSAHQSLPYCECNPGYKLDNSTKLCKQCTYPCATCQTSVSHCLTCASTYTQDTSAFTCNCLSTQYEDNGSPKQCQNCSSSCLTCSVSSTYCTTCDNSLNRLLENNQCICQDGYYDDNGTCEQCSSFCDSCSSASICLTCEDPTQIVPDCKCTINQYFNTQAGICEVCQMPCVNCFNAATSCTECPTGYYLSQNQCLKCSKPCSECIDSNTNCIQCTDLNQYISNNTCICNDGWYMNSQFNCNKCDKSCSTCINTSIKCLICADTYVASTSVNDECVCPSGYYEISTYQYCLKCSQFCINCQSNLICTQCLEGYYLESDTCQQCNQECQSCISQTECILCKANYFMIVQGICLGCSNGCEQCINQTECNICQTGYYIVDQYCIQCSENCLTCINSESNCLTCRINYELIQNECQCKLGYFEQNNECIKCDYPCLTCAQLTVCQSCALIQQMNLTNNNQCECNQGYFYKNSQCLDCNSNCLTCKDNLNYCLSCDSQKYRHLINNQCVCIDNYYEDQTYQCKTCNSEEGKIEEQCQYKDCNDKQWTYGEQCDDGNTIIRDGCSNCEIDNNYQCINEILKISICYQCSINCKSCQFNENNIIECTECEDGYFIDQYQCSKCSDKCIGCQDNSNNCIKCRFIQNNQTKQCQLCEEYQQGYYSDYVNNQCYTKCGDSYKSSNEECDDGNLLNNDGCDKQCKLEKQYVCQDGICITPNYPIPSLSTIGDTSIYNNIRQFKLEYDQQLNITNEFNITDQIQLLIFKDNQESNITYPYEITQSIEFDTENAAVYSAIISLSLNTTSHNEILMVKYLNISSIISSSGYAQQLSNVTIQVNDYIIIDLATVTQVQTVTQSNAYVLYVMGVMAGGAILFGGLDIFYNLLDTIQMLSYLKYANVQMPYNLGAFFDFFGFAQLNIISKYLNLQELIDPYIDYSKLTQVPDKIANDSMNSLFIINGSSLLVVWITFLGTYWFATLLPGILNSYKPKYYSDTPGQDIWLIRFRLYYLAFKIFSIELCNIIVSEFFFSGILRIQMSTSYDYCFSFFLQIYGLQLFSEDPLVVFSCYLALLAGLIYISTVFFIAKLSSLSKFIHNQAIGEKFGSVFEGIKQNYFCKYFNSILLIKKMLFMAILILGYNFPYFQIVNLTLLSCIQSLFLIVFKPLEDFKEYLKQLVCEINTFVTLILLTVLAIDEEIKYFDYEVRQNIGWGCIFFISAILGTQLLLDAIQQWQLLYKKYKQLKHLIQRIQNLFKPKPQQRVSPNVLEPV